MTILSDWEIEELCDQASGMITPFIAESVKEVNDVKALSFGLSSYGYDVRLAVEPVKIFTNIHGAIIDL